MTEGVHQLKSHQEPKVADPEVVKFLEDLLDEAKAGKITGIAVAWVQPDDLSRAAYTQTSWAWTPGTYYAMTHAIAALHRRWGDRCDLPDLVA